MNQQAEEMSNAKALKTGAEPAYPSSKGYPWLKLVPSPNEAQPIQASHLVKSMSKTTGNFEFEAWSEWNPANFDRIVTQYQPRIYRFIYSMVGDAELAQDLTQDTFMLAYRNLRRRAENKGNELEDAGFGAVQQYNMSAWLYTIARNSALSELRRRKIVRFLPFAHKANNGTDEEVDGLGEIPQAESGGSLEARAALHDELQQAMDKVGREKLTALLLHMDGFSYKEICDITGDSLSSVKSQIFRAKESLRRVLAQTTTPLTPDFGEGRR